MHVGLFHSTTGQHIDKMTLYARFVTNHILFQITVLGTPAEEGGGGKIDMIKAGVFDDIDVAMMVHPCPKTVSHGSFAAVDM